MYVHSTFKIISYMTNSKKTKRFVWLVFKIYPGYKIDKGKENSLEYFKTFKVTDLLSVQK